MGTRMMPFTEQCPKAMLLVNGIPFIDYQLRYLSTQGIKNIIICIGHFGKLIKDYVGDGSSWGLDISYSDEGEILLGTARSNKINPS